MRHTSRFSPLLVALFMVACSNVTPTPVLESVHGLSGHLDEPYPRAAFLPPIGTHRGTGGFFANATVTVEIFDLGDGTVLEPEPVPLRTFAAPAGNGFYEAMWNVRETRVSADRVRVRVMASDLSGSVIPAGCGEPCIVGSFDAVLRKVKGRPDRHMLDLTKTQTLPIRFFIGRVVAGSPSLTGLEPLSLDSFDDVLGNCAANEISLPGQGLNALGTGLNALGTGLNALGTVGGLFLMGEPESQRPGRGQGRDRSTPSIRLFHPGEAGELAGALVSGEADRSAAILIVDDFRGDSFDLSTELTSPDNFIDINYLTELVGDANSFSHGALVLHQTSQMVVAAGFTYEPDGSIDWVTGSPDFRIYSLRDATTLLLVVAVDTSGFDTDGIADNIRRSLHALELLGIQQVAINMSFVIVPCAVLQDFKEAREDPLLSIETFEDYVAALGDDNDVAAEFYEDLVSVLLTPVDEASDPLRRTIECDDMIWSDDFNDGISEIDRSQVSKIPFPSLSPWGQLVDWPYYGSWKCDEPEDFSAIYVASSGNFGFDYPMYPAAWSHVVGASSNDATATGFGDVKSSFSNSGQVMAPGALFELSTTGQERAIAYAGTSFSAPVVSLFTAIDLMTVPPQCGLAAEAFAYKPKLSLGNRSANEPLAAAVDRWCAQ